MRLWMNHSMTGRAGLAGLKIVVLICIPCLAQRAAKPGEVAGGGRAARRPASLDAFNQRVKAYVKLRARLVGRLPKISSDSRPAEIEAHQVAFGELLRAERADAKAGDIFTPDVSRHIRKVIQEEFKGARLRELRQSILQADTKGVQLRINYQYPEVKESLEVPPTLLTKLPELPEDLRYRFVGHSLLLVDRGARLIIDYLPNALP
jgi:hypothetical protein